MRFLIAVALMFSTMAMSCDFSQIRKVNDYYLYPVECHIEVGSLVKRNKDLNAAIQYKNQEAEKLEKALSLKDLEVSKADERIVLWKEQTYSQHDRLLKQQSLSRYNDWMYFGGGILAGFFSVWAASKVVK